jgi:hypothetical protein
MTEIRNFPPQWTGELTTIDLSTLEALPPDTHLQATLVIDHPDSPGLHALSAYLIRHECGRWESYVNHGYCLPNHGGWDWDEMGDTGEWSAQPPLDDLAWQLDLAAEQAVDGNPELATLQRALSQEWRRAACMLEWAIKQIPKAG